MTIISASGLPILVPAKDGDGESPSPSPHGEEKSSHPHPRGNPTGIRHANASIYSYFLKKLFNNNTPMRNIKIIPHEAPQNDITKIY